MGHLQQELDGATGDKAQIALGTSEEVTPYFLCLWIGLLCAYYVEVYDDVEGVCRSRDPNPPHIIPWGLRFTESSFTDRLLS